MCTAAAYTKNHFYFGRTLDLDRVYGEEITILPRNMPLPFRKVSRMDSHYAMIGMAHVAENYPLFYEAMNEKGLGMAGLNFPNSACFHQPEPGWDNIAPFEFIPWVLGQCACVEEARELLQKLRLVNIPFSSQLPLARLHWIIADRSGAIVVESVESGLHVYDNPTGVLTNEPPFPMQMFQLNNYMNLSPSPAENRFSNHLPLNVYSRGMGAIGLPGDLSSQSRFVRAVFVQQNSLCGDTQRESVNQFFHILGSVCQPRGCTQLENGEQEITVYTSCCDGDTGTYYYTTYENPQITAVDLRKENLDGVSLARYPVLWEGQVRRQN